MNFSIFSRKESIVNTKAMHRTVVKSVMASVVSSLKNRVRRVAAAGAVAAALGLSQPVLADFAPEGWGWWGNNQCLYQWDGSKWVLNGLCVVPDSNIDRYYHVYYLNGSGQVVYQLDARDPNWFTIHFPDNGLGTSSYWLVPNRGSYANMFFVEPQSFYFWDAQGQRWTSFAELSAAVNVQSTSTYTPSGGMVIGGPNSFASGVYESWVVGTGAITIGGGCTPLSSANFNAAATAAVAAGQAVPSNICYN
jgi:hypothetical protein